MTLARAAFVSSCIDTFVRGHFGPQIHARGIFDGFDVDWEYPEPEDAANYLALLKEFRKQLDAVRPGLRLTIAAGPSPHMYHGVDFGEVAKVVDEIGLMNYDYSGPWRKVTGFHAPLYSEQGGEILLVVKNLTPEIANFRDSKDGMYIFHLKEPSFKMGDFVYKFVVEAKQTGNFGLQYYLIPFLAPVEGQEFPLHPPAN